MIKHTLIFIGPPGSGKGTQSDLLAKQLDLPKIDVGNALRKRAEQTDAIGKQIKQVMHEGRLLEKDIVEPVVEKQLVDLNAQSNSVILDGYARNKNDIIHIERLFANKIILPPLIISIELDEKIAVSRIKKRIYCEKKGKRNLISSTKEERECLLGGGKIVKRDDDNIKTITNRFRIYEQNSAPIQKLLKNQYPFLEIDGKGTMVEINKEIRRKLKTYADKK